MAVSVGAGARALRDQLASGGSQLLPALEAPCLDHANTPGGAHPIKETVHAPAIALLGLKSPFH